MKPIGWSEEEYFEYLLDGVNNSILLSTFVHDLRNRLSSVNAAIDMTIDFLNDPNQPEEYKTDTLLVLKIRKDNCQDISNMCTAITRYEEHLNGNNDDSIS